jgi:hypothetical protein
MNMLKTLFAFSVAFITLASSYQNDSINYAKKKNIVLPVEFAFNRIGLSYERALNEYISLRFPLQISVGDNFNSTIRNSLGTQLLFFPLKHKSFLCRHFCKRWNHSRLLSIPSNGS